MEVKTKVHKCGDCGQKQGQLHLPNCDIERCPKCELQLLSCDCIFPKITVDEKYLIDEDGELHKRHKVRGSVEEDFGD